MLAPLTQPVVLSPVHPVEVQVPLVINSVPNVGASVVVVPLIDNKEGAVAVLIPTLAVLTIPVNVGDALNTVLPVPVLVVTPVPPEATAKITLNPVAFPEIFV